MNLLITVNYNNSELTNKMIESILADDLDIIVVDNNSNDKSILNQTSNIEYIFLKENIGYFPALNIGLKKVNIKDYDYIIICNNDLKFSSDFFTILYKKLFPDNVYAVCPRILDLDNVDQNPMLDKKISKFKVFFYDLYYKNYYLGQFLYNVWQKIKQKRITVNLEHRQVFMGYGAIYILTKNFFKKNLELETPPFLMFEETFLAHQIYESGGIEFFDSDLLVYHQDHSTCSKVPRKQMYDICKESYAGFRARIFKIPSLV